MRRLHGISALLYEQLEQGATDDEILAYMVARYGEFVRIARCRPQYGPVVDCPGLLLIFGAAGLLLHFRQRPDGLATDLSEAEQAQIARLLGEPRD